MKRLLMLLFLCLPLPAHATYAEDKAACSNYGGNLALFATYRDENMPRDTLIDKLLGLADKNKWDAETTLLLIYMAQYAYAHPELSPAAIKAQAYATCMKQRGYVDA